MILRAAVLLSAVAMPASAQLVPAPPSDIAAALKACLDSSAAGKVDTAKLEKAGWSKGLWHDKDGKQVEAGVDIYGAKGNGAMIVMIPMDQGRSACMANARIDSFSSYPKVANAISDAIGSLPFNKEGDALRWRSGTFLLNLEPTGSRETPAVRAAAIYVPEEKK